MLTYEQVKIKACETFTNGAMAIALANDHETVRKLANSMIDAARLLLWLEDCAEAAEKGDLEAILKSKTNNGF